MSTKKLQILGSLGNSDADTLDGKHASDFAAASDVERLQTQVDNIQQNAYDDTAIRELVSTNATDIDALEELVGDEKVSDQIAQSLTESKSYTDTKTSSLASTTVVENKISAHNTSTSAHNDIRTLLTTKVDKVSGKDLSTNDYTTAEKNKLAGIADGANKTVVDTALSSSSTNPVQNKIINAAISNLNTLVGDKTVSSQIATAIASKSDVGHNHDSAYDTKGAADTALASAKTYADSAATKVKNDLLNGAGAAYDTLKELGDLINDNQDAIEALETVASGKADAEHIHDIADVTNLQTQLNAKVPTSRTVNGKALSANITLSASDVGADASGAANTALTNAKAYTDAEITEWVGDKTVSEQITAAIANKSDSNHTHDGRYYTESEIDTKLSGKSDTSHTHSAYVNQNAFSKVTVGSTTIEADNATDTLTLVAGSNVTLTPDASGDKITIAAKDTTYTHPNSGVAAGTYKSVTVNAQGHVTGGSNPTTLSGYGITDAATKTELNAVSGLVGDTKVSTQISEAIKNKADTGHTHSAYVNQNAFSNIAVSGQTTVAADSATDTLTLVAGSNVTITTDATNDKVTIAATDTKYTHPSTSGNKHIPSGGSSGQILRWSADGTAVWGADNNTTYSAATQSAAGLMSAADKTKLDGIATGANKITVDSALSSTSTNPVQNKVVNTAISNLNTLVGDKAVSEQINTAIGKIDFDEKISDKADIIQHRDGSVITMDNSAHTPMKGLKLYGKTIQNGTPTPEAPIPLESVGDDGSVAVTVCGKNLISFDKLLGLNSTKYSNGLIDNQNVVTIDASTSNTEQATVGSYWANVPTDGTYAFSAYVYASSAVRCRLVVMNNSFRTIMATPSDALTGWKKLSVQGFVSADDRITFAVQVYRDNGDIDLSFNRCMVEVGSTATEYEPYNVQTLTAQTPNGLPGIPVSSGGNYTDENGQQWICDEIDFARCKYLQRVKTVQFRTVNDWDFHTNGWLFTSLITDFTLLPPGGATYMCPNAFCTHFPYKSNRGGIINGTEIGITMWYDSTYNGHRVALCADMTLDEWKTFVDKNEVLLSYPLATPIETDLSDEEIIAYAALHTNYPNTTVYNDAGAGMEVKYYTPTTAVQMVHSPADEGKILAIDEHGCVVLSDNSDINIYTQNEEPLDAPYGSLWVDLDAEAENEAPVINVDTTLTQAGQAADAKAVGDAIEDMVYSDDSDEYDATTPLNADTLGGRPASEFATETFVQTKIAEAQLDGGEVDLSGYATKDDLNTLTAEDVGARPNTWLPSISDIGAAPSGYGLGVSESITVRAENIDSTKRNGWYRIVGECIVTQSSGANINLENGLLFVHNFDVNSVVQKVIPYGSTAFITRKCYGGAWDAKWVPDLLEPYPVGAVYISAVSTSPASLFGGTWEFLPDRFLLGAGNSYLAGTTGGASTVTLTTNQIPSHTHRMLWQSVNDGSDFASYDSSPMIRAGLLEQNTKQWSTTGTGGGAAHNNMPPYLVVYMWKRIA